jgi:PhnB protein
MTSPARKTVLSFMLAVPDTPVAVEWYKKALGAHVLWSLGSVAGLEMDGAPFFLHEPVRNRFESPAALGVTTARVELLVSDPDQVLAQAIDAGATGSGIEDYTTPWGKHRQGGFTDPFGHHWLVGDKAPLDWPDATQGAPAPPAL